MFGVSLFEIRNLTAEDIQITVFFKDINETEEKQLSFGEAETATITNVEETVDYVWTATANGVLKIASSSENRVISINVVDETKNVTETFDESDADGYIEISVTEGAKVTVSVGVSNDATQQTTIVFTATFTESAGA